MMEDWKMKISVLWIIVAVAYVTHPTLVLLEPHTLASIIAEKTADQQIGLALLSAGDLLILVPLVMAFLSLILKDSINRWANTIVGSVFAVIFIWNVVAALILPAFPAYSGALMTLATGALMTFATFVVSALIVWYAWTPKST
jgi:hypothetical protein